MGSWFINKSMPQLARLLSRTRIIVMLVIAITAFLVWAVFVYNLTGWDAKRFTGETLMIFGYSVPIMLGVVAPAVIYGTKPIWDSYARKDEKKTTSETKIEEYEKHTRGLIDRLDKNKKQMNPDGGGFYSWEMVLRRLEEQNDLLFHLYTDADRSELYELLFTIVMATRHDAINPIEHLDAERSEILFNQKMGELARSVLAGGEQLKGACTSCLGMFPIEDAKAFREKFDELQRTQFYRLWTRQE
jgi:hypothetical protein